MQTASLSAKTRNLHRRMRDEQAVNAFRWQLLNVSARTIGPCLIGLCLILAGTSTAAALEPPGDSQSARHADAPEMPLESVTFARNTSEDARGAEQLEVRGQVLLEAQDGGLLLLGRDGRLWNVPPRQLQTRIPEDQPFSPLAGPELGEQLRGEFGAEFQIVQTRHYVICTNAGPHYARWCGSLFERLLGSFLRYWRRAGLELHEPGFPLVAIIFRSPQEFAEHATAEIGPEMAQAKGYYSVFTNRIVLFDLTAGSEGPVRSAAEVSERVSDRLFNVATVVHEATHQVAYNTGLHVRLADNPLWLVEGLAMYFETPDLRSRSGWRSLGKINPFRVAQLRADAPSREPVNWETLIGSDAELNDADTAASAYARVWALNYFLIQSHRDRYVQYLKLQQKRPRLQWRTAEERVAEFESVFGDCDAVHRALVQFMSRMR